MTYEPKPIVTGSVELPEAVAALSERLAEHIHDVWASRRMAEGWRYGALRSDEDKTHPGLVPYAELSELEKEYDRATALESIRAILTLGYRIISPGPSARTGRAR